MNNNTTLQTQYDLLAECCKFSCDQQKIDDLVSKVMDWESLLHSAYMHGIFPLVYSALKSNPHLSHEWKEKFKHTNFKIAQQNLLMTGDLLKVLQLLQANDIRAIALKGPVLSQMIHGDVTKRQFSDLDLLIAPSQMYQAVKILTQNGYAPEYDIKFLNNKTLLKVGKDFPVKNSDNDVLIEFHWQLFLKRYIKKSNINLFSEKNHHCMINHTSVETLELNAMLLYLLLHGSKHYWERIEWVVDIDRLLQQYKADIDWDLLKSMAKEMEIEFMFYLGLAVSKQLLDTPLEPFALSYIDTDEYVQKALKAIIHEIYTDTIVHEHSELVSFENLNKIVIMKDKTNGWLRQYFVTFFEIKELDVYMVNLPNYLSYLYHIVRLYRLFNLNILRRK